MGLSKSKTTTGPSKQALPHINAATDAVNSSYQGNIGNSAEISGGISDAFKDYQAGMGSDLTGARTRVADVLGGRFLNGNPQLQGIIDQSNNSVTDRVNAIFSRAGQTGSSRQTGELGKQLSDAEQRLRYQSYMDEQARMDGAVGQSLNINSANNANQGVLAGLGESAIGAPLLNSQAYAQGIGGLWGNATTTKSSPGIGQMLLQAAAQAGQAAASGGMK